MGGRAAAAGAHVCRLHQQRGEGRDDQRIGAAGGPGCCQVHVLWQQGQDVVAARGGRGGGGQLQAGQAGGDDAPGASGNGKPMVQWCIKGMHGTAK
jgi:hypothetical protein